MATVTVNEDNLVDSGGTALAGYLRITTPAYLLPEGAALTITGATNASPIVITITGHGYSSNQTVYITGVLGNTAANGTWRITVVDANTFSLTSSTGNGAYTSGGTSQRLTPVGPSTRRYPTSGTFSGSVNFSLEPTTTAIATPSGAAAGFTHLVTYVLNDGTIYSERWSVPTSPTTTTISAIRSPGTLNPTATVDLDQLGDPGTDTRNSHIASDGTKWVRALVDIKINAQTGTSYTVVDTDRNKLVTFSNTSAVAVTLPQAGASSLFVDGWYCWMENINTGLVTITPTTSTIDTATSLKLRKGQGYLILSNGTNYIIIGDRADEPRSLFTSTADRTQANTASEVTIVGTGVGSLTLPANFYDIAGKSLRVIATGYYSNTGTPTLTVKLKHGSTVLASTGAVTTASGVTNKQWTFEALVTCRTTGATGTVICQGVLFVNTSGTVVERWEMVNTATVTIDTTATQAVDLTIQWGTASASNTDTGSNFAMWPVETGS